jgi:antitoxin component YwqK of YwqJK toxin-antitoxin module
MKLRLFVLFVCFCSVSDMCIASEIVETKKKYIKVYFNNGTLKAEGWIQKNHKTDYWIFYYETGIIASKGNFRNNKKDGYWYFYRPNESLEKEGHYTNDVAENWWIFYDIANRNKTKFQYKNNQKNGFAICYDKKKLVLVEKYTNDLKVGEWTSIWTFKRDNPDASF